MTRDETDATFRQLLEAEEPALRRMLRSYERDPALRDELFQDVCLAIWRALHRFRGDASLRTFAYRIAHNRAVSHVVRQQRRPRTQPIETASPDDDVREPLPVPAPAEQQPHSLALDRERRRQLESALRALPIGLRQTVVLRLEGLSHGEIAEVLGISENASAIRLNRAAARLRSELRPDGNVGGAP